MQDDEIGALICILKQIIRQERMTAQGIARKLGFSASHLSMIFAGKRRPGIRFIRAVMAHYPKVRQVMHTHFGRSDETRRKNAPR